MRALLLCLMLLPALARADVDARFGKIRDSANRLPTDLVNFLTHYIGECSGFFEGQGCRDAAAAFRKAHTGERFFVIVPEKAATMLREGPYNPRTGEYEIIITPIFRAGDYALTEGAPNGTDSDGNPVLPTITIKGLMPVGWDPVHFARLFEQHQLRLQVVFTPKAVWHLPEKDGGTLYGVSAQIDGLLITWSRTGDRVGAYYGPEKPRRGRTR